MSDRPTHDVHDAAGAPSGEPLPPPEAPPGAPHPPPRHDPPPHDPHPPPPGDPRPPPRRASHLIAGLVLLAAGVLWLLDVTGAVDVRWRAVLPAGLIVVGLAVVVLSLWDRAGELIGIGIVLTALVVAAALLPDQLSARVGDQVQRPASVTELQDQYSHGIGQLTIDLREVAELDDDLTLSASLGVGELLVRVPPDVTVVVAGTVGVGEVSALGRSSSGVAVDLDETTPGAGGAPVLRLELSVGIGKIEVAR